MALQAKTEATKAKPRAVALGKPAQGQCLCGSVCFEIDVPARWAWHDHSAESRRAHGAAYATYDGSWRKRFRITKGEREIVRYEHASTKRCAVSARDAERRLYTSARAHGIW